MGHRFTLYYDTPDDIDPSERDEYESRIDRLIERGLADRFIDAELPAGELTVDRGEAQQKIVALEQEIHDLKASRMHFCLPLVEYLRDLYPDIPGDIQAFVLSAGTVTRNANTIIMDRVILKIIPPKEKADDD